MRYRKPTTRSAELGQFFTPPAISRLLARQLGSSTRSVLELGAGAGALATAVSTRFPSANLTLVELDRALHAQLAKRFSDSTVLHVDVVNAPRLHTALGDRLYSAAIGNPPFSSFLAPARTASMLEAFGPEASSGHWHRTDLVFAAESLARVRPGGTVALILAAPLIAHAPGQSFRAKFMTDFSDIRIYELPAHLYQRAKEVQSYLLCGRRAEVRRGERVLLARADIDGNVVDQLRITRSAALTRMDFSFHEQMTRLGIPKGTKTLQDLGAIVVRGSRTHAQFESLGADHLHTTDLEHRSTRLRLPAAHRSSRDFNIVEAGDIAVPRVGTRCLTRQALVERGGLPYSESIYRIRLPKAQRTAVFDALEGPIGQAWRQLHAHGSCAKHLTLGDLLALPIV